MMKTRAIVTVLTTIVLGSAFVACGDKVIDNSEFNGGTIPYDESKTDRAFLEETATKLLALFNARDQQKLLGVLNRFAKICDNGDFPDNFNTDYTGAAATARSLSEAIADYDGEAMSRAATNFAYSLARFKGLYQYNDNINAWQYLEDNDNAIFRFWNGGNEYNVSVSGIGGSWHEVVSTADGTYNIDIPKQISVLIIDGSISLKPEYIFSAAIDTDGKDSDHLNITTEVTAANLFVESAVESTNTRLKQTTTLSVDNVNTLYRTRAIVTTAEVNGQGLCSAASWVSAESSDNQAQALGRIITNASSTIMIMDRVQLKSKLNNITTFLSNVDGWWDRYDGGDPEARARQAATALISSLSTDVYYANNTSNNPVRARLSWEAVQPYETWDDNNTWTVRPLIVFTSDNTPYDFESYFGNGRFLSVQNQLKSLMSSYSNLFR